MTKRFLQVRSRDRFAKVLVFHVRAGSATARYIARALAKGEDLKLNGIIEGASVELPAASCTTRIVDEEEMLAATKEGKVVK